MAAKSPAASSGNGSTNGAYDADAIQTLEGLEAVRKRPGMYIGGTGSDGLIHLVWELIDNAVDEAAAGFATKVEVTLHRDKSVEVTDDGRGIPVDKHAKRKVSALEVVFTELHAGGKFGGGAYGSSGGLHGVGASVVNALAAKLVAEVDRDGHTHQLSFHHRVAGNFTGGKFKAGHTVQRVKKVSRNKTGTRVRFWPDYEIFDSEARIDFDEICDRATQACFLVPGMKVTVTDKRNGADAKPFSFVSRGGLSDLVEHLSEGASVSQIVSCNGIDTFTEKVPVDGKMTEVVRECVIDVALRWVDGYDTNVVSFVNTIPTSLGGTHMAGFDKSLTRVVNNIVLKDNRKLAKLAKENKKPRREGRCAGGSRGRGQGHLPGTSVQRSDQAGAGHPGHRRHRVPGGLRPAQGVVRPGRRAPEPREGRSRQARDRDFESGLRRSSSSRTSARRPASAPPACPRSWLTVGSTVSTPS